MALQRDCLRSVAHKMEECDESRGWEEMIPDTLGLIFQKLSLQEILTVIPRVCKSWKRAASGPYCWQEINIEEWSKDRPQHVDRMLHMLVMRSACSFRKLCVSGIPNDSIFSFIADYAGSLQTLVLPRSEISDSIVEQVAGRLSNVTFLDISYCSKIGPNAIEAFGSHCKSLVKLKRIMHPQDVANKVSKDDEALAIARTMPKLKHLELSHLLISTKGVLDILSACKDLEYLDIGGCWEVKLDGKSLKEKIPSLEVVGPLIYWDNMSDFSDSSGYLSWDFMDEFSDDEGLWDDGQGLVPLELAIYGGVYDEMGAEYESSPSP